MNFNDYIFTNMLNSPDFKEGDDKQKRSLLEKYIDTSIAGEAFNKAPAWEREEIKQTVYGMANVDYYDQNTVWNATKSLWNNIIRDTATSVAAGVQVAHNFIRDPYFKKGISPFKGVAENTRKIEQAIGANVNPGIIPTLAYVGGEIGQMATGIGLARGLVKIPKYASLASSVLPSLAGLQGMKSVVAHQKMIQELEATGTEVSEIDEVVTTIGHGLSGMAASLLGAYAAKGIYSLGRERVGEIIRKLESAPATRLRDLGQAILNQNFTRALTTMTAMAGVEAGEEAAQQVIQNLFNKLIDVRFGVWDNVLESALWGGVGGGMLYGALRGMDWATDTEMFRFIRNIKAEKVKLGETSGNILADLEAMEKGEQPIDQDNFIFKLNQLQEALTTFSDREAKLEDLAIAVEKDPSILSDNATKTFLMSKLYELKDIFDTSEVMASREAIKGLEDVITDAEVEDITKRIEENFTRFLSLPADPSSIRKLHQLWQEASNLFSRKFPDGTKYDKWYNDFTGFREQYRELTRKTYKKLGLKGRFSMDRLLSALNARVDMDNPLIIRDTSNDHVESRLGEGNGISQDDSGTDSFTVGEGVSVKYVGTPLSRTNVIKRAFEELDARDTSHISEIYVTDNMTAETISNILGEHGLALDDEHKAIIEERPYGVAGVYIEQSGIIIADGSDRHTDFDFITTLGHEFWHGQQESKGELFRDDEAEEFGLKLAGKLKDIGISNNPNLINLFDFRQVFSEGFSIGSDEYQASSLISIKKAEDAFEKFIRTNFEEIKKEDLIYAESFEDLEDFSTSGVYFFPYVMKAIKADPIMFEHAKRIYTGSYYARKRLNDRTIPVVGVVMEGSPEKAAHLGEGDFVEDLLSPNTLAAAFGGEGYKEGIYINLKRAMKEQPSMAMYAAIIAHESEHIRLKHHDRDLDIFTPAALKRKAHETVLRGIVGTAAGKLTPGYVAMDASMVSDSPGLYGMVEPPGYKNKLIDVVVRKWDTESVKSSLLRKLKEYSKQLPSLFKGENYTLYEEDMEHAIDRMADVIEKVNFKEIEDSPAAEAIWIANTPIVLRKPGVYPTGEYSTQIVDKIFQFQHYSKIDEYTTSLNELEAETMGGLILDTARMVDVVDFQRRDSSSREISVADIIAEQLPGYSDMEPGDARDTYFTVMEKAIEEVNKIMLTSGNKVGVSDLKRVQRASELNSNKDRVEFANYVVDKARKDVRYRLFNRRIFTGVDYVDKKFPGRYKNQKLRVIDSTTGEQSGWTTGSLGGEDIPVEEVAGGRTLGFTTTEGDTYIDIGVYKRYNDRFREGLKGIPEPTMGELTGTIIHEFEHSRLGHYLLVSDSAYKEYNRKGINKTKKDELVFRAIINYRKVLEDIESIKSLGRHIMVKKGEGVYSSQDKGMIDVYESRWTPEDVANTLSSILHRYKDRLPYDKRFSTIDSLEIDEGINRMIERVQRDVKSYQFGIYVPRTPIVIVREGYAIKKRSQYEGLEREVLKYAERHALDNYFMGNMEQEARHLGDAVKLLIKYVDQVDFQRVHRKTPGADLVNAQGRGLIIDTIKLPKEYHAPLYLDIIEVLNTTWQNVMQNAPHIDVGDLVGVNRPEDLNRYDKYIKFSSHVVDRARREPRYFEHANRLISSYKFMDKTYPNIITDPRSGTIRQIRVIDSSMAGFYSGWKEISSQPPYSYIPIEDEHTIPTGGTGLIEGTAYNPHVYIDIGSTYQGAGAAMYSPPTIGAYAPLIAHELAHVDLGHTDGSWTPGTEQRNFDMRTEAMLRTFVTAIKEKSLPVIRKVDTTTNISPYTTAVGYRPLGDWGPAGAEDSIRRVFEPIVTYMREGFTGKAGDFLVEDIKVEDIDEVLEGMIRNMRDNVDFTTDTGFWFSLMPVVFTKAGHFISVNGLDSITDKMDIFYRNSKIIKDYNIALVERGPNKFAQHIQFFIRGHYRIDFQGEQAVELIKGYKDFNERILPNRMKQSEAGSFMKAIEYFRSQETPKLLTDIRIIPIDEITQENMDRLFEDYNREAPVVEEDTEAIFVRDANTLIVKETNDISPDGYAGMILDAVNKYSRAERRSDKQPFPDGVDINTFNAVKAGMLHLRRNPEDNPQDMIFAKRLAATLQSAGWISELRISDTQLTDFSGRPVNGAIHHDTGVMWLSPNILVSTVGHEAMHRYIAMAGRDNIHLNKAIEEAGGIEELADMVGEYFGSLKLNLTRGKIVHELINSVTYTVNQLLGKEESLDGLIAQINFEMVAGQKNPTYSLSESLNRKPLSSEEYEEWEKTKIIAEGRKGDIRPAPKPSEDFTTQEEKEELETEILESEMLSSERIARDKRVSRRLRELNTNRIATNEAVKQIMERTYEEYYETHRFTINNIQDIQEQAKAIVQEKGISGMASMAKEYNRTGRLNLVERHALRMFSETQQIKQLERFLRAETHEERAKALSASEAIAMEYALPLRREAGLGLAAFNLYLQPNEFLIKVLAQRRNISPKTKEWILGVMENAGYDMANVNPEVLYSILRSIKEPTFSETVWAYYISNILSSIGAQGINLTGGVSWMMYQLLLENPVRGAIRNTLRAFGKDVKGPGFLQAFNNLYGLVDLKEQKKAIKLATKIPFKGPVRYIPELIETKAALDMHNIVGAFARSKHPFLQKVAPIMEPGTNGILAIDAWLRIIAMSTSLHGQGRTEGLKGKKLREFLNKPSKEAIEEAREFAREVNFSHRLGSFGQSLVNARNKVPFGFGHAIVAFMPTLTNILKRSLERVPLINIPASKKTWKEDPAKAIGFQVAGAFFTLWLLYQAWGEDDELWGNITGAAPLDPDKRDLFYSTGRLPNSVKVGIGKREYWVSLYDIPPFSVVLGMVGTAINTFKDYEFRSERELNPPEPREEFLNIMRDLFGNSVSYILQSTWTRNLNNIFDRLPVTPTLEALTGRMVSNFIHISGFWRDINRWIYSEYDGYPVPEYMRGWTEVTNSFPLGKDTYEYLFGNKIENKRTALGEEIKIPSDLISMWFPIKIMENKDDTVEAELYRLNLNPTLPERRMAIPGGLFYTIRDDKLWRDYILRYGKATKDAIRTAMEMEEYKNIKTNQGKREFLSRAVETPRRVVTEAVKAIIMEDIDAEKIGSKLGIELE